MTLHTYHIHMISKLYLVRHKERGTCKLDCSSGQSEIMHFSHTGPFYISKNLIGFRIDSLSTSK